MLTKSIKAVFQKRISGTALWNEVMKRHTTYGIGGPADVLILPHDETDLHNVLEIASEKEIPVTIIGNGSNLLVSDDGIDGVVVKIRGCFDNIIIKDRKIIAGGGCYLPKLMKIVADAGLTGLEFLAGIPGALGGTVVMNAGTRKMEIGDVVTRVRAMNDRGELVELDKEGLQFGYRQSNLQGRNLIVLSMEMELAKGNTEEIKGKIKEIIEFRKKKQPVNFRSAGSIFKNPPEDYAGRLIESCGFKGMKIGSAQVSELHANFIVNLGNSAAHDVFQLMRQIRETVLQKYGVELEPEIKFIGRGLTWKNLDQD